jgi:hypothetical protein
VGSGYLEQPENKEKLDELAFMAEKVKIILHETSEPNADPVVMVSVNGRSRAFKRGVEYVVPRSYVGVLASAKPVHYTNEEYTLSDGSQGVRWPSRRGLRYPFGVIEDSPKGRAWLKRMLQQQVPNAA